LFLLALCGLERTAEAQIQLVPDISTVVGSGTQGYSGDGGVATSAALHQPTGVAADSAGNLYIADFYNQVIRKVAAGTGIITTVAGTGTAGYGGDEGPATSAALNQPYGVTVDSAGNLYIADFGNERIRKVAANTGTITTVAGTGGLGDSGYGGPATSAALYGPTGVAVDNAGNLFIADTLNNIVLKVAAGTGIITVVAGNGTRGYSGDRGAATSAELNQPFTVSVDSKGNLYIADSYNQRIREVAAGTGTITTVAGDGMSGYSGDGGSATDAELNYPDGVTADSAGNLYIVDSNNQVIRFVAAGTGTITTVAGNGSQGYSGDGGPATSAELSDPFDAAIDIAGNLYIADTLNDRIRKVTVATGSTLFPTTAVGSASPQQNLLLQLNAAQTITRISAAKSQNGQQEYDVGAVTGCAVDSTTTNASGAICSVPLTFQPAYPGERGGSLQVVAGTGTFSFGLVGIGTAPQIAFTPATITTVAGNGTQGYSGDGGPATSAELNGPGVVVVDTVGNLFIAELHNNSIRKVAAGTGTITTVAGNGIAGYNGDGGPATSAELNYPSGVDVDNQGNLYIADTSNYRIRKVDGNTGTITTVAGNGIGGYSGDGGPATSAELNTPGGVRVDNAGNLFIADTSNHVIRKVAAGTGTITTVAGNGTKGYSGDGGPATSAELHYPDGVTVDSAGNLYIADTNNNRVREVAAGTGTITTVAGNGMPGYSGDGGPATSAELFSPYVAWVDSANDLYIADTNNQVIRKVASGTGIISTVAGTGTVGYSGDGAPATSAEMNLPFSVALDGPGNLYITDFGSDRIRKVDQADPPSLSFDPTNVGATSSDSPQTVKIGNIGNQPLAFSNNPSYPSGFPVNSADTALCSSGASLNPGTNCDVSMSFIPTAVGNNSGSVLLTDNTLNISGAMQAIPLSGTGIALVPALNFAAITAQTDGNPPFRVSATSDSSGAVTYTVVSGPATIMGSTVTLTGVGTVVLSASQTASGNYAAATATTSFVVSASVFTLTSASSSATTTAGGQATYSLTLTPASGTTIPDAATLSATGLPTGATATFSPAMITAGSGTTTVMLTIRTSSNQTARNENPIPGAPLAPVALGLLLLPLAGMKSVRTRLRQIPCLPLLLAAAALFLGAVLTGCSGNGSFPSFSQADTYTVIATATDATRNAQSSVNLTLTVK
jgi:sugar lactone lactonase YvrE